MLTFAYILSFIESFTSDGNGDETRFELIDQYLTDNKVLMTTVSSFDNCEEKLDKPKQVAILEVRNVKYKVTERQNKNAFALTKLLNCNYDESLRVISASKENIEISVLAENILRERSSIIEIVLHSLNNTELPVLENKLALHFAAEKTHLCKNLISLLSKLVEKYGYTDNSEYYPDLLSDYLTETEYANIINLKKSEDLIYITNILKVLTILSLNSLLEVDTVISWFTFMDKSFFFFQDLLKSDNNVPDYIIENVRSLVTLNTLLVLGINSSTSSINTDVPYFNNTQAFITIINILSQGNFDPVINYMWSFVLFTKAYMWEDNPEKEQQFINTVFKDISINTLTSNFAAKAESENVFLSLKTLSKSLSIDPFHSAIICSFLTFALHFIPISIEISEVVKYILLRTPKEYVEQFLISDAFENKVAILKAQIPLIEEALLPLVNLSTVNIEFAHFIWNDLNTYTVKMKLGELDYDLVDDAGYTESDLIILKKEALVKPPLEFAGNVLMPILMNTRAKILLTSNSDKDDVIVFLMKYNGWSILGRTFQSLTSLYFEKGYEIDPVYKSTLVSILELITNVLDSDASIEKISMILGSLSENVKNQDIISVTLKLFESALQMRSYTLLCVCSEFLVSLYKCYPELVWSYLAKSNLLDRYGKTGYATTILGSIQLSNGEYDFTISIIKLANQMAEDSSLYLESIPVRSKLEILEKLISHLLRIYEAYQSWKYVDIHQRLEIGLNCTMFFNTFLKSTYGMGKWTSHPEVLELFGHSNKPKHSSLIFDTGLPVVNAFLSAHSPDIPAVKALMTILLSSQNRELFLLENKAFGLTYSKLVNKSFELSKTLISTRSALCGTPSTFEKRLFEKSSNLVNVYRGRYKLKGHIISLFGALVAAPWKDNYPFLLSYIGESHSKIFFDSIANDLESNLVDFSILSSIYNFFSTLVESKQDGLSILFLSGNVVSSDLKKREIKSKSILDILKKNALSLESLPKSTACELLEAIAFSLNSWTEAKNTDIDNEFINSLMTTLKNFAPLRITRNTSPIEINDISHKYRLISRIVEIFALYLYSTSETHKSIIDFLEQNNLASIVEPFFKIESFNKEEQINIFVEFETMWPGYKLTDFIQSSHFREHIDGGVPGYDIHFMDRCFGSEPNWESFRSKLYKVESNYTYVLSQISAAKAWGALLTSFVRRTPSLLNDNFIQLVVSLLQVNIDQGIPDSPFIQIYCERLELCFYFLLSYQKASKKLDEKTLIEILNQLMLIIKSNDVDYLKNIPHSTNCNIYRPVLRSILIILSMASTGPHFIEMASDQLLEFFEWSFCKGGHLLFAEILTDITTSTSKGKEVVIYNFNDRIKDLCLLLSVFTEVKALTPSTDFNKIMASSMNDVGTLKVILNLYSSSHLFKLDDEPVLGSITLAFISKLCSIREVAETFITNGLLSVLLESPLSVVIQQGNLKLESQSKLHSIWSHGLLTILLLLLSKFGSKILAESCLFVSYFSKQIKSTILIWSDSNLTISSALIRETSQLIMLQKMLDVLGYQEFLNSTGSRSKGIANSLEIELVLGLDTEEDRKQLNMAFKHLLTHPKYLKSRVVPSTLEEQRFLDDVTLKNDFIVKISKSIQDLQESLLQEF